MNELQAGIEFPFAVLPEPSVFLQPGKAALDNPALGHDLEGVQFAAFGNLHGDMLTQNIAYALRKRLAHIAAIAQNTLHLAQFRLTTLQRLQGAFPVRDFGGRDGNGMRKSLRIHGDVALDARYLLTRVVTLLARRVRILHALRIDQQKRAASGAPLSLARRAKLIFLTPAPAG